MLANTVAEAVEMLSTALDLFAGISRTDWEGLPLAERLAAADALETGRRRALAAGTTVASTLVSDEQAALAGGPRQLLADWLRITTAEAKHRLDHAAKIDERTTLTGQSLPPVLEATAEQWHAGLLDEEHLTVILDFFNDLPADTDPAERDKAELFLAQQAAQLRPDQLKGLADQLAITINPDGIFTDADRQRQSGFSWSPQHRDGMSKGVLWATPELRAGMDAHFAHSAAPGKNNPADQTPCTDGEPDPEAASTDLRTPAQRRHDALNAMVRRQLGDPALGTHNGLPVTIIVSTTVAELHAGAGHAVTAAGTLLPIPDLIRLASHSYLCLTVFDDLTGRPLWLGKTRRCASPDQRIVLHALDRGCTFPGCDKPGYLCEVHHVDEWAADGPTDIDNLTFACGQHHKLIKPGGWKTRKLSTGHTQWIPPAQLELPTGGVNTYHHPERYLTKNPPAEPRIREDPG